MSIVLITGGAGFIGSHIAYEFLKKGIHVIIVDNRHNHTRDSDNIKRLRKLCNENTGKIIGEFDTNLNDFDGLTEIFNNWNIDGVIHCAGLKSIADGVMNIVQYFETNLYGSVILFDVMRRAGVKKLLFTSSGGVYSGNCGFFSERDVLGVPEHTYGQTKRSVEYVLQNMVKNGQMEHVGILRLSNVIDLDVNPLFVEDVTGTVSNLLPTLRRCEKNNTVFNLSTGYINSRDGSAIRDYIQVQDVAYLFDRAWEFISEQPCIEIWNCSTGKPTSTIEMVNLMTDRFNLNVEINYVQHAPHDRYKLCLYNDRIRKDMNWKPAVFV